MAKQVLAFIALVAFAGIAWGQHCSGGVCKLVVTVAAAGCADPANITVLPDPLPVPKKQLNKIEWTIRTTGYTFVAAPNGITSLPSSQFTNPHVTGSGKKYDLRDANTDSATIDYKYDVHLQKNGTPCAVKDPIIRNGS